MSLRIHFWESYYELLKTLRQPAFVLPSLAFPVVFYALFAILLPGNWGSYERATYLLATYGVFGVIGPALFGFGVGLALEQQQGLLRLKRVSPMPISAYFVAKIVMSLVFASIIYGLLSLVGVFFGDVDIGLGQWLRLGAVLLLGVLPFCALGLLIGSMVGGQAAVAIVNLVYLPMAVLSGLWIPLFVFPQFMQDIAVIWPAWHLAQMALGVVGQVQGVPMAMHTLVLLLMTTLFLVLAAINLRR
jgi:ABC-2 type transport system permease protein